MPRRPLRPGVFSRRRMAALRHTRSPEHLQHCDECRMALRRERQYLERLRGSAVPEASQDLAARLIQHTERLAKEPGLSGSTPQYSPLQYPHRRFRGLRVAGITVGTLMVSAGALGVSAYVIAGDAEPQVLAGTKQRQRVCRCLDGEPCRGHGGTCVPSRERRQFDPGTAGVAAGRRVGLPGVVRYGLPRSIRPSHQP